MPGYLSPGKDVPLLSIPEYSGINKDQKIPDRSKEHTGSILLNASWQARRSNQSILKEINPKYSLEGLMLKPQYFGHMMRKANSLGKTWMLGQIEGKRRRGRHHYSMDLNLSKLLEIVKDRGVWGAAVHGVSKSWTRLSTWTTTTIYLVAGLNEAQVLDVSLKKEFSERQGDR